MTTGKERSVIGLQETDRSKFLTTGGKGANLGELSRINGIQVPEGFCVTTTAYHKITGNNQELKSMLDELSLLKAGDNKHVSGIGTKIRGTIESLHIPYAIEKEIADHIAKFEEKTAFAIRSSATAEDMPMASFAGQQDSYLNITGKEAILKHISKCWASLFTDRAIIYRIQNGFDHRSVQLAVIVQQMVHSQASGIMFTADPVTGNRKVVSVDAGFGLGEAMVSGLVNADNYTVIDGSIITRKISTKKLAVYAKNYGGTKVQELEADRQTIQVLTDAQILQLEKLGRKIEAHFGAPQDIEWCLAEDTFYFVQSRPITTGYPIPKGNDLENHVYLSVGHQQMMTDAMKPLGLSLWQLTAFRPMFEAGGRLFVDITPQLASTASRRILIDGMGEHDPLIKDAIINITSRGDFVKMMPEDKQGQSFAKYSKDKSAADILSQINNDESIVTDLIRRSEESIALLKRSIQTKSGTELFDFILEEIQQLRKNLMDPQNSGVFMAAINASSWINKNMEKWLGEKNAADALSQSVPNNITSEMGLDLLDLADVIRPYPEVIDYLQRVKADNFLDDMGNMHGGQKVRDAIHNFLDKYGMRCAGEIDITRPRWSEKPGVLIPILLNNIKNVESGAAKIKFEQGLQQALKKEQELLNRLLQLPDGLQKGEETKQMISLLRNFIGYREYPKYRIVSHLFICKQALLKEADKLVRENVIREKDDVFYLSFEGFRQAVNTKKLDLHVIMEQKEAYKQHKKLTPPRVITSAGEIVAGRYNGKNIPPEAIAGLAVSSGIAEGRARVILNMGDANFEEDDVLVTAYTDPSWTPLFLSIKGLVTEVGGLMTHGAVIAREYGLPAVVGVENATTLINDGQRIRVNGTDGYVEIISADV